MQYYLAGSGNPKWLIREKTESNQQPFLRLYYPEELHYTILHYLRKNSFLQRFKIKREQFSGSNFYFSDSSAYFKSGIRFISIYMPSQTKIKVENVLIPVPDI